MKIDDVPIPAEVEERSWQIAREAFVSRTPNPRGHRVQRSLPAALAAAIMALIVTAVALSATSSHVIRSLRRAIGVQPAATVLVRLPTTGRVLVNTAGGPWIVNTDGSKRRLGAGRSQAAWSPHGLFEAVVIGQRTLAAIDPKGNLRWSLARTRITDPRWSGEGYRIAYRSATSLRVVAGDGTGDRQLATRVAPVAPAWQGATHRLAYVGADRRAHLVDADTARTLWRSRVLPPILTLAWQPTSGRLIAATTRSLQFLNPHTGKVEHLLALPGETQAVAVAANGSVAVSLKTQPTQSSIELVTGTTRATQRRLLFHGAGTFDHLAWSPNSHWLLAAWPTANQWLFIDLKSPARAPTRVQAIAAVSRLFDTNAFPQVAGWCCSGQPQP